MATRVKSKTIKKSRLNELLDSLAQQYDLIAPVNDTTIVFRQVKSGSEVTLDYINSALSPKNAYFPQTETLFRFFKDDNTGFNTEPVNEPEKGRIIFGIRACDARSIRLMDMVFDGQYKDSYYLKKREESILIGMACSNPAETCFCPTFGIDPTSPDDMDIMLTDINDRYLVEASTEKGVALLDRFAEFFDELQGDEAQLKEEKKAGLAEIKKLEIDGIADKMAPLYDDDYWARISMKCLGCGICTYLCPTCHCFDLVDDSRDRDGERLRCWDSCMFADFTLMASGENPRPDKRARIQQRFFHKFNYFHDRYDALACVGCGRCLKYCPVNIDITRIISDVMSGKTRDE
jgi:sulfhydrogenase subunit beta (sulfur reductase)